MCCIDCHQQSCVPNIQATQWLAPEHKVQHAMQQNFVDVPHLMHGLCCISEHNIWSKSEHDMHCDSIAWLGTHISLWHFVFPFFKACGNAGHVSLEAFIIPSVTVSTKSYTILKSPEPQHKLNAWLDTQVGCTRGASWQPLRQGCRCVCLWSDHVGDPDLAGSLGRPRALAGTALPLSKACNKNTA